MSRRRLRPWMPDEEAYLIKTVDEFIRQGRTKQEAFRYIGIKLGRTAGACDFHHQELRRAGLTKEVNVPMVEVVRNEGALTFKLDNLLHEFRSEIDALREQLRQYQQMEQEYNQMKQDYATFMRILETARKQTMGTERLGRQFAMEPNGNLIPVDSD